MMYDLAYLDGDEDLLAVCERIDQPIWQAVETLQDLIKHDLIELIE